MMLPLRSRTMSCSPSPVMSASRTRGSARSTSGPLPLLTAVRCQARRGSGSLNQHSSRVPERSTSVSPSPSRSISLHARVGQADAGRLPVGLERAAAPAAREGHREVPGRPSRRTGVRARTPSGRAGRRRRRPGTARPGRPVSIGGASVQQPGQLEPAAAGVAPVPPRRAELDQVRQPGPVQVDQRQGGVAQRRRSAGPARSAARTGARPGRSRSRRTSAAAAAVPAGLGAWSSMPTTSTRVSSETPLNGACW